MEEQDFQDVLIDIFDSLSYDDGYYSSIFDKLMGNNCQSFSNAGLLTCNKGVVINLKDGSHFQITIVKDR